MVSGCVFFFSFSFLLSQLPFFGGSSLNVLDWRLHETTERARARAWAGTRGGLSLCVCALGEDGGPGRVPMFKMR